MYSNIVREPKLGSRSLRKPSISFLLTDSSLISWKGAYPSIRFSPEDGKILETIQGKTTFSIEYMVIKASPLRRYNNGVDVYRTRNIIPHPDKPGDLKYDESSWIPDPDRPGKMKWNDDPNFVSDHAKAIIEEARMRKELMEEIIKKRDNK